MPHKHKRRRLIDEGDVDLPPSSFAKPLPVDKAPTPSTKAKIRQPPANTYRGNDTPKAFARLMSFRRKGHGTKGLDNGEAQTKKRGAKPSSGPASHQQPDAGKPAVPKILPGERISDFAARVDRALPISGLATKGKKINGISDHRVTKHERKLKRLQENWRKEDVRLRAKAEEERELAEEQDAEERELWEERNKEVLTRKGKKVKRKRLAGEVVGDNGDGEDDDPWAVLKDKDKPRGLMDVVQAPPTFKSVPKEKFKVRDGARVEVADVPNAAGSLRRREELGSARKEVIARYRDLMATKKVS
jgi:hypothetical protein